jgi:hypothetical protein
VSIATKYGILQHILCVALGGKSSSAKITNTELNWLYSALIAKWPIDPTHLTGGVVATSSSGDIGSGCCLSILAISLKLGITRNPNHLLPGYLTICHY